MELAAQRIADTLAPAPQGRAALWRWGTVETVNADGTMDVDVAGTVVESLSALTSATGAEVGDRVRIDFLGADAVVAGVLASSAGIQTGAVDMSGGNATAAATLCQRDGTTATVTMRNVSVASALASGSSVMVGIVPEGFRPPADYVYEPCVSTDAAYTSGFWVAMHADGKVTLFNRSGASLPTTAGLWFTATYCT